MLSGTSSPYLSRIATAFARVEASGTVGPEAISDGSSPGTSEMISAQTLAGAAAMARRPPLISETCFRTQFISAIVAPERSKARASACSSASEIESGKAGSNAEPPPEIRQRTKSSAVRPDTASRISRDASSPAASGTGCAASRTRIRRQGAA